MEKLRNKKAGVIVKFLSLELVDEDEIEFTYELPNGHENACSYSSLEKFKEEWEIYKPVEPLIENEEIRKAVRAWAEVNDLCGATYSERPNGCAFIFEHADGDKTVICFRSTWLGLEKWRSYGITELCGEDKE